MNKVKGVFSKIGAWIKAHTKICIIILVVVILAIILIANLVGGAEKRAIKKYISALNSNDDEKIIKAMNIEAAAAWNEAQYSSGDRFSAFLYDSSDNNDEDSDVVKRFEDYLDDVQDSEVKSYKERIEDSNDNNDKNSKIKLLKIEYSTPAKDNKDLKKVVIKYKATTKPSDDDKDDKKDSIWKSEKEYTAVTENYMTIYLYKGKVISYAF